MRERRLNYLERRWPEPAPSPPADAAHNFRQLTLREQYELDTLLAVTVPLHGEPPARPMTEAETARLAVLFDLARIDD